MLTPHRSPAERRCPHGADAGALADETYFESTSTSRATWASHFVEGGDLVVRSIASGVEDVNGLEAVDVIQPGSTDDFLDLLSRVPIPSVSPALMGRGAVAQLANAPGTGFLGIDRDRPASPKLYRIAAWRDAGDSVHRQLVVAAVLAALRNPDAAAWRLLKLTFNDRGR